MKSTFFLAIAASAFLAGFSACKKDSTSNSAQDIASTTSLSQDLAISDNISGDINNAAVDATNNQNIYGAARPEDVPHAWSEISIHDSSAHSGLFGSDSVAKVIVLTFNSTFENVTRSGTITIVLTDTLRDSASTMTLTFNNYYVNGYKREGSIVWVNTTSRTADHPSWTRTDNGKVTAPNNNYWSVTGTRAVEETTFGNFTIDSGDLTVTNASGASATATVLSPISTAWLCPFIEQGKLQITGPGGNRLVIDYSAGTSGGLLTGDLNHDGECDNIATYSLNGGAEVAFFLVH